MPWMEFLGGFQTALDAGARQQQLLQRQQALRMQEAQFEQSLLQRQAEAAFRQQLAQDQFDYGQQRDAVGDAFRERAFDYQVGRDDVGDMFRDRSFRYGRERDEIGDEQWRQQFGLQQRGLDLREQAMQPQPPSPMELAQYRGQVMRNEKLQRELDQPEIASYPYQQIDDMFAMVRAKQQQLDAIVEANRLTGVDPATLPAYQDALQQRDYWAGQADAMMRGRLPQTPQLPPDPMQQPIDGGSGAGAGAYFGVGTVPDAGAQAGVVYARTPTASSYGPPATPAATPVREVRQPELGGAEQTVDNASQSLGAGEASVFQRLSAVRSPQDIIATDGAGPSIIEQYQDLMRRIMNTTEWPLEQRQKMAESANERASALIATSIGDPSAALGPMLDLTSIRRQIVSEYQ